MTSQAECWNAFCVATDCDGVRHVDVTGYPWEQNKGMAYNPDTGDYDRPDDEIVNGVWTDYYRYTADSATALL